MPTRRYKHDTTQRDGCACSGRFGDAGLERLCVRQAARHFGQVRTEDLGRLPARVVAGLLGDDGLGAGSEDEVCRAVAGTFF